MAKGVNIWLEFWSSLALALHLAAVPSNTSWNSFAGGNDRVWLIAQQNKRDKRGRAGANIEYSNTETKRTSRDAPNDSRRHEQWNLL